jgi:hypothetical protein
VAPNPHLEADTRYSSKTVIVAVLWLWKEGLAAPADVTDPSSEPHSVLTDSREHIRVLHREPLVLLLVFGRQSSNTSLFVCL